MDKDDLMAQIYSLELTYGIEQENASYSKPKTVKTYLRCGPDATTLRDVELKYYGSLRTLILGLYRTGDNYVASIEQRYAQ